MIRIAVCDDDKIFLGVIGIQIREFFRRIELDADIRLFNRADDFCESFDAAPFHIAILDIIMPDVTGMELSRRIYEQDRNCAIAFLTSSPDYALEGYGVNAVGYLLKPPTQERLEELLNKCLERRNETRSRTLVFKVGGLLRKVDSGGIVHLESRNKQVVVHGRDGDLVFAGKLSDLLERLPPNFVQTHKSYIANLDHAHSMTREELIAADGSRIPVSRQYYKDVQKRYLDYGGK